MTQCISVNSFLDTCYITQSNELLRPAEAIFIIVTDGNIIIVNFIQKVCVKQLKVKPYSNVILSWCLCLVLSYFHYEIMKGKQRRFFPTPITIRTQICRSKRLANEECDRVC